MTCDYDFVEGDTSRPLENPFIDENGAAVDLTGKTVNLRWLDKDGVLQSKQMTVSDPLTGIASYKWAANELYPPSMDLEFEVVNPDATRMYSDCKLTVKVRGKLG